MLGLAALLDRYLLFAAACVWLATLLARQPFRTSTGEDGGPRQARAGDRQGPLLLVAIGVIAMLIAVAFYFLPTPTIATYPRGAMYWPLAIAVFGCAIVGGWVCRYTGRHISDWVERRGRPRQRDHHHEMSVHLDAL